MPRHAKLLPTLVIVGDVNRCCLTAAMALLSCERFCCALLMLLLHAIEYVICTYASTEVHPCLEHCSWRSFRVLEACFPAHPILKLQQCRHAALSCVCPP